MEKFFSSKKSIIGLFIGALLLAGGGFGYYLTNKSAPEKIKNASESAQELLSGGNVKINVEENGDFAVKEEDMPSGSLPDLNRAAVVPSYFPADAKQNILKKIASTIAALKKDPTQFNEWLNLGIYRKMIDDYEGARDIWEFLTKTNPTDFTAYANLANIYGYYLHDATKAEVNYLKAIELEPTNILLYRSAADFYRDVLKDGAKARTVLEQGIEKNPDTSQDLKTLLGSY